MPVGGPHSNSKPGHVVGSSPLKCMALGDTETRWGGDWGSAKLLRFIRHVGHTQASLGADGSNNSS